MMLVLMLVVKGLGKDMIRKKSHEIPDQKDKAKATVESRAADNAGNRFQNTLEHTIVMMMMMMMMMMMIIIMTLMRFLSIAIWIKKWRSLI